MLTLLFNRYPKRQPVGLLALGEWGPATGAISGSCSTDQARQQTFARGTVVAPAQIGSGGGGGGDGRWIPLPAGPTPWRIPAIAGQVRMSQAAQNTIAIGEMIDAELEMFAILAAMDEPEVFWILKIATE